MPDASAQLACRYRLALIRSYGRSSRSHENEGTACLAIPALATALNLGGPCRSEGGDAGWAMRQSRFAIVMGEACG